MAVCLDRKTAPVPTAVMRITLTNFRNYEKLHLKVTEQPIVLTGTNGIGKTNLIEAVSFLTPGRGLRRARLSEIARHGTSSWSIAATVMTPAGPVEVGTGLECATYCPHW
ncbi:DNA recombination and repair protein RecF [invertebrate metagenome]|uniref:DNA recombination and repair protein RecF n=1 Tax=invertebrate metagenome TaxID=1711999 RepID=A0A484H9H5_9ZZZZ